ncbi:MAG: nuclear transport factor 2 family protein [Armatimonadetes bacterium]|nr:nuclear transport factor 2 family protein [Armatimonadota bacterium]MDE2207818.1 nuclear transport factor 2 family protein [Armatimonadota bacterium]
MMDPSLPELLRLTEPERELLKLAWDMLAAIHSGDFEFYAAHCTPDLSCYEDVCPYRIDGLEFHLDMIRVLGSDPSTFPVRFDLLTPRVQLLGDTGVVTFTRLTSRQSNGVPHWSTCNETRVFTRSDGTWKMAHFHRSGVPG